MNNTPLVMVDQENSILTRMHHGIATDVFRFEQGHLFYENEIEHLRVWPVSFKKGIEQ